MDQDRRLERAARRHMGCRVAGREIRLNLSCCHEEWQRSVCSLLLSVGYAAHHSLRTHPRAPLSQGNNHATTIAPPIPLPTHTSTLVKRQSRRIRRTWHPLATAPQEDQSFLPRPIRESSPSRTRARKTDTTWTEHLQDRNGYGSMNHQPQSRRSQPL